MGGKHTPGPWEWVGNNIECENSPYEVMTLSVKCSAHCYGGNIHMEISDQDKHLISAAPDMLMVLERLLVAYDHTCGVTLSPMFANEVCNAIAKAKGE